MVKNRIPVFTNEQLLAIRREIRERSVDVNVYLSAIDKRFSALETRLDGLKFTYVDNAPEDKSGAANLPPHAKLSEQGERDILHWMSAVDNGRLREVISYLRSIDDNLRELLKRQ